jgi:hypothetical protein
VDLYQFRLNNSAFRFYTLIVLVMLLMLYVGYELANYGTEQEQRNTQVMSGTIAHAQAENLRLNQSLSQIAVELAMQQSAQTLVEESYAELIAENESLQQKIALYELVLGESEAAGPFAIHSVSVMALPESQHFLLDMLLLQGRALKSLINGNLVINIIGTQDEQARTYALSDLFADSVFVANTDTSMRYRYQYFLEKQFVFALPEGFTPTELEIKTDVYQWKRKRDSFTQQFTWSDLIAPNT